MSVSNTFQQDWAFPSEVVKTVPFGRWHDTRPTPGSFKTGRQMFETIFLDDERQKVVGRRQAMELISKGGKKYFVCRRQAPADSARLSREAVDAIMSKQGREPLGIDDVFGH